MRKVMYQQWLPDATPTGSSQLKLSEERVGFLHQWGLELKESGENICSYSVAIIEDEETKGVLTTYPHLVTFID
jgi:hypothetical protein